MLVINLKKGKAESMVFGNDKCLCSHDSLKVAMHGSIISSHINMNILEYDWILL